MHEVYLEEMKELDQMKEEQVKVMNISLFLVDWKG